jgi:phosphoglycerate-specific signal transduction histidine kinase
MSEWLHEVKQPLTAINNYASAAQTLLSEQLRLTKPISEADARRIIHWLDEISNQANRIVTIVEERDKLFQESDRTTAEAPAAQRTTRTL